MAKVTGSRSSCRSRRDLKQPQSEFNLKFSPLTQQRFFPWAACYGLLFVGRLICYINSASIGIVKSNQPSILNYHSVFRLTVNSQQSTVNNNSGATGIDIISLGKRHCRVLDIPRETALACPLIADFQVVQAAEGNQFLLEAIAHILGRDNHAVFAVPKHLSNQPKGI